MAAQETRAGDLTTVAGAGGQFAPPLWLTQDFVALARAGRVTADLMNKDVLPSGVSSINLPTVTGGAATAVQATQNTNVQDTAMVTSSVASGITTISGQQIVAMQLIAQSGIPFDKVVLLDLARDYATKLDVQVISGSGAAGQLRGLFNGANVGADHVHHRDPQGHGPDDRCELVLQQGHQRDRQRLHQPLPASDCDRHASGSLGLAA